MNLSEFSKLETVDVTISQRLVQRWRKNLNTIREPEILAELIDYYLSTQSLPALRILVGLKDLHSQDFFIKVNDCLHRQTTRLLSLRLLAHMLSGQASWLYKMVHSPVFPTLLQLLKTNTSMVVLTSTVYVLCALIPLTPYHITPHLPDLFECFTRLATLPSRENPEKLPQELCLSLQSAVYYLFLQLYALYPCSFLQYLKGRFGPTGEVQAYQEYIAPLFNHVQLHPNLITELPSQETQRTRWSSKDPHEIATLALSLCLDPCLVPMNKTLSSIETVKESKSSLLHQQSSLHFTSDPKLCGTLNSTELAEIWSPSLSFGQMALSDIPRNPSCGSTVTTISSPNSELNSLQTTPRLGGGHHFVFNYSPTASVETDTASMMSERPASPSMSSLIPSGRSSPIKQPSSCADTPKSFKEKLTNVFKRHSDNTEVREDFTNISVSEFEVSSKREEFTQSESLTSQNQNNQVLRSCRNASLLQATHPIPLERENSSCSLSLESSSDSQEKLSLSLPTTTLNQVQIDNNKARSYPNVDSTVLLASEKLEVIAKSQEPPDNVSVQRDATHHRPSFITITSVDSITTMDTLTPVDNVLSPVMMSRSVLKDKRECSTCATCHSPLSALDMYIENGRLLHHRSLKEIPLTELEGIDWNHFGTCPHTEELSLMHNLNVMVHSQLLFERYQCQQHAKRNRRLMTKSRNASKLENEIVTLHHCLHQHQEQVLCLKAELSRLYEEQPSKTCSDLISEKRQLQTQNSKLQEQVTRLSQELSLLKIKYNNQTEKLKSTQTKLFTLQEEKVQVAGKLSEIDKLKAEVLSLTKEHLLVEELYHQQQLTVATLKCECTQLEQMKALNEALSREKEDANNSLSVCKMEIKKLKQLLEENNIEMKKRDNQILALKSSLQTAQDKYTEKSNSLELKYQTIKVINQQLQEVLLDNKSRGHLCRHKNSDLTMSRSSTPSSIPL